MAEETARPQSDRTKLPAQFWILWTGNVVNRAGGFVNFVLAFYLTADRGFDSAFTGLVIGVLGGSAAAGAIAGGYAADVWGRRLALAVAQVGTAASMLLLSLTSDAWQIIAAAALLGGFQGMARPVFGAMMVDVIPPDSRMRAYSLSYWGNNLAAALAASLGGFVATLDYQVAFYIDAATTLLAALLINLMVKDLPTGKVADGESAQPAGPTNPWRDRIFLVWCLLTFAQTLIFAQHLSTLPLTISEAGHGPATFGLLITINTVLIVALQLLVPRFLEDREPSKALAAGSLVVGIGFGLTAFAGAPWTFGLTIVVWTIGEMMQNSASGALTAGLSPRQARGRYQGVWSLSISLAMLVAPVAGGLIMAEFGDDVVWLACFVLGVGIALAHLAQSGVRELRVRELETSD